MFDRDFKATYNKKKQIKTSKHQSNNSKEIQRIKYFFLYGRKVGIFLLNRQTCPFHSILNVDKVISIFTVQKLINY